VFRGGAPSVEFLDQINKASIVMLEETGLVPRAIARAIARVAAKTAAYFVAWLADIRDISFAPLRVINRFGSQRARASLC
ncbi:MAG: hypothetical protein ACXW2A_09540, partial [Burkholderiales bacterium]